MTSFDVYRKYLAISNHFKGKYDFFKYNGIIKVSERSFQSRKDRYFFDKIAKKYNDTDVIGLIVSNTVGDPNKYWLSSLDAADETFIEWRGRCESLAYQFAYQCDIIIAYMKESGINFNGLFSYTQGIPPIIRMQLRGDLFLETVVVLDYILGFSDVLHPHLKDDPMWCEQRERIKRYKPFLSMDVSKYKKILVEKVKNAKQETV